MAIITFITISNNKQAIINKVFNSKKETKKFIKIFLVKYCIEDIQHKMYWMEVSFLKILFIILNC